MGCFLLLLGGIIPALIYADATNNRVQCANCGHIFRQPPLPNSPVSKLSKWLIAGLILFVFLGFLMITIPELASIIPKYKCLSSLEEIIAGNPYTIAFCLSAFCIVFLVTTVMSSIISNAKLRSDFQKEYKTHPEAFSEIKERNANKENSD